MIRVPQFAPHLRIFGLNGEAVALISETENAILRGELAPAVASRIDGRRSADDIAAELDDRSLPADIYYLLDCLEEKGYVIEAGAHGATLWAAQGLEPAAAERQLAGVTVAIAALDGLDPEPFRDALRACRVRVAERGELTLVLTDDYLRPELEAFHRDSLRTGRSWMLAKTAGQRLWVGPVFVPGRTGCWACLAQRLRLHLPASAEAKEMAHGPPPPEVVPGVAQIAAPLVALQVARWIAAGEASGLHGRILVLDPLTWQVEAHALVRLPHCRACGAVPKIDQVPPPPAVAGGRRAVRTGGGYRVAPPEEMLERYGGHVSRITGVVWRLERCDTVAGSGVYVHSAGFNPAMLPAPGEPFQFNLRSRCAGKGTSDAEARASALGEALERYCAQFRGDEPRRTARLADLGDWAIHPNSLMGFSRRQYERRDAWNARGSRFAFVPVPFDEEMEVEWSPVWSLSRREVRYLPTACCYLSYPEPAGQRFGVGCSNGSAAGNTLAEAILQGFFEVVERDAVALWWYSRVRRPAVDLEALEHPVLARLRAFLRRRDRELWVLDLTSDLGVPVFAALSRASTGVEGINLGFGAHFDPEVALLRAVTEQMQTLAALLPADGRPGLSLDAIDDPDTRCWLTTATLDGHPYLAPDPRARPSRLRDFATPTLDDLEQAVLLARRLVERHGMEMLVLDQTRREIGLPVAKVIIPGMRHFWARFAPGRLYEVPVALGWLDRPLAEEELNPVPIFL